MYHGAAADEAEIAVKLQRVVCGACLAVEGDEALLAGAFSRRVVLGFLAVYLNTHQYLSCI